MILPYIDLNPSPPRFFPTIQIDPPWPERGGGKIKRGADRHYPLMSRSQIARTILRCDLFRPAENAHLWLWVTDNYLPDGLWLMDAIGFSYKRTFPWVKVKGTPKVLDFDTGLAVEPEDGELKLRYGIGQYARGAHEILLFGTRGRGQDESVFSGRRDIPSVILAPNPRDDDNKRIHSRKPDAAYELIEARSYGPYLEMFARRQYSPEWTCWGNEAG